MFHRRPLVPSLGSGKHTPVMLRRNIQTGKHLLKCVLILFAPQRIGPRFGTLSWNFLSSGVRLAESSARIGDRSAVLGFTARRLHVRRPSNQLAGAKRPPENDRLQQELLLACDRPHTVGQPPECRSALCRPAKTRRKPG
jgi:hypothetical protein